MSTTTETARRPRDLTIDSKLTVARARTQAVVIWAWIGAALLAFEGYTWLTWLLGPNFKATNPGPSPISSATLTGYFWLQIAVAALALAGAWFWIVRPWIKTGQMTTDGMMAISCWSLLFYDCSMNYTTTTVLYNSYMFNRGSWTSGSWLGWISPNGNLLPEPLLITGPGYLCLVFSQVLLVCWMLRKAKARWPSLSPAAILGLLILGMTIVDSCVEIPLLRTGLYAYPGGIRSLTLFAGHTYQFPLTEGFTFGGLGVGAITALRYFKNDRGQTWAERGIETLRLSPIGAQWMRFLAIFGFCHLTFILLFTVPNQWLGLHSGAWPSGYPSYMINNMCVDGAQHNQCPGPGVLMSRP
jgi:hypothetical protein